MRTNLLSYVAIVAGLLSSVLMEAQCSNFVTNYPQGVFTTNTTNWSTITNCAYGGEFQRFEVLEGATYQFRTCGPTNFDSEITLWDAAHANSFDFETNNCNGTHGVITWTATYTGEVNLLVTQNGCQSNTQCARVQFRMRFLPPAPANNTPCSATLIDVNTSCEFQEVVQAGATASGVGITPSCGNGQARDIWYQAVVPPSGAMVFSTAEGTISDAVMAIYSGNCSALNEIACSDDVNGRMPEIVQNSLTPGSLVYIRLFSFGNQEIGTMRLCVFELCTAAPSNDLVCNAQSLTLGSTVTGRNDCSTDTGDSWLPSCWTAGRVNSVWYSFTAPLGGEVTISTNPQGAMATQIAVFSGDCNTLTEVACNQSAGEGCGANGSSSLLVSGLTGGDEYFIMLDGQGGLTGYFDIIVSSLSSISPQSGSDCSSPLELCNDMISFANPGPQGTGALCDFDGNGNCTEGERNSIWYQINVGATGNINFTISPNDASSNSCVTETDYDFLLWKISGQGQTTDCSNIASNSGRGLLSCNYSGLGVTGIASSGDAPSPYSNCFDDSFEPTVAVTNGDVLLLVIQNYQGSTIGFNLDLSSSDPGVVLGSTPTTVYWNGGANADWNDSKNWGNCGVIPSCQVSAVIPASAPIFPEITDAQGVHDLVIETGASLKLSSSAELHLCGDFINYGSLDADPSSYIIFDDPSTVQNISGNLTGGNAMGNLIIEKDAKWVRTYTSMEVKGDFETISATSMIRTRQNEIIIGGDFLNARGATTYRGTGPLSKLIFNGNSTQTFNQGTSDLYLNQVVINKPGGRLMLETTLHVNPSSGSVELLRGVIETGAYEVEIMNESPLALNEGNPASYIEGTLLRAVDQTGLYHFPVGHAATGYQRADLTFRSNNFSQIRATHSPWVTVAGPLNVMECQAGYNLDALDNGFFTLTANGNQSDYDIALYNYNYSNTVGAQGWTVMKDSGSGWMLDGNCVSPSSAALAQRTDLTGFSRFATAQASTPLPVEFLSFSGVALNDANKLEWITASEVNNQGFTIESSKDGYSFEAIGYIEGAGNSNAQLTYEFFDRAVSDGLTYYRLRQTDFDGQEDLSRIIVIERKDKSETLSIYPNPTAGILFIDLKSVADRITRLEVSDAVGKVLWTKVVSIDEASNSNLSIDLNQLQAGHYTLQALGRDGQQVYTKSFVRH